MVVPAFFPIELLSGIVFSVVLNEPSNPSDRHLVIRCVSTQLNSTRLLERYSNSQWFLTPLSLGDHLKSTFGRHMQDRLSRTQCKTLETLQISTPLFGVKVGTFR